jgi:hypothetical protein
LLGACSGAGILDPFDSQTSDAAGGVDEVGSDSSSGDEAGMGDADDGGTTSAGGDFYSVDFSAQGHIDLSAGSISGWEAEFWDNQSTGSPGVCTMDFELSGSVSSGGCPACDFLIEYTLLDGMSFGSGDCSTVGYQEGDESYRSPTQLGVELVFNQNYDAELLFDNGSDWVAIGFLDLSGDINTGADFIFDGTHPFGLMPT